MAFEVPFVCGCRNLGEALRRIGEGAAMLRTKLTELRSPSPGVSVPQGGRVVFASFQGSAKRDSQVPFTSATGIKIANLRLGFPIVSGDTAAAQASGESAALATDDLLTAINAALTKDLGTNAQSTDDPHPVSFRTIHVQSPFDQGRFLLKGANSILGIWNKQGVA